VKSLLFKLIGVTLGFLVAFTLAEAAVRIISPQEVGPVRFAFNPDLGMIPVPYQHGVRHSPGVFDFAYTNNSLGWRGRQEYREQKSTEYRILMLGDSFTYGIGVNDDQTFAAQVERDLQANHLSVEVMNAGNPGTGTDYALKLFQTRGKKFRPDLTVLCFFCNDFEDNERAEYYNISKSGEVTAKPLTGNQGLTKTVLFHLPGYNWLISWSQAANLVKQAAVNLLANRGPQVNPAATQGLVVSYSKRAGGYATPANEKLTHIYLEELQSAVQRAGGSLIMFYIPMTQEVNQYRRTHTASPDEQALRRLAVAQGLKLWSLTPLLALSGQPTDRLYYKEGHWTAAAHSMAAGYMSRIIASRLRSGRQPADNSRE
jgi:hypothetical protein